MLLNKAVNLFDILGEYTIGDNADPPPRYTLSVSHIVVNHDRNLLLRNTATEGVNNVLLLFFF